MMQEDEATHRLPQYYTNRIRTTSMSQATLSPPLSSTTSMLAGAPLIRRGGGPTHISIPRHVNQPQQVHQQYHHQDSKRFAPHRHAHKASPEAAVLIAAAKEQRLQEHREKRRKQIQSRYKTEMCKSALQGVACQFGDTCSYAHCPEELREGEIHLDHHAAVVDDQGCMIDSRASLHHHSPPSANHNFNYNGDYSVHHQQDNDDVSSSGESYVCHYGQDDCCDRDGDEVVDRRMSTATCDVINHNSVPPSIYSYKPFVQHPMFATSTKASAPVPHPPYSYQHYYCCGGGEWEESMDECGITIEEGNSTAVLSCNGGSSSEAGCGFSSPLPSRQPQWYTHNPYARF